jgi:hypothetical protein
LFSVQSKLLVGIAALIAMNAVCGGLSAQDGVDAAKKAKPFRSRTAASAPAKTSQRTATIHWQRVPLRDAIGRLHALFDDAVFVDRRVDPNLRITLDIEATSAEEVIAAIATGRDLGAARLGRAVYLGPSGAANQLRGLAAARSQEVARLPAESRSLLTQKQPTNWPRLGEPRALIASIVEHRGWRFANADAIPYDLWSAGSLPAFPLAEQLTVLLIGFDLTFELRPNDRIIQVVPMNVIVNPPGPSFAKKQSTPPATAKRSKQGARQEYTLRVPEQPVGLVLQALAKKLNWTIQIDEDAIRKAGRSLATPVSFSVENVDQEHLLDALLSPAGLDYRFEGEQIRIIPRRNSDK